MNPEEFLELVAEMRKAQRLYFADRSARALDYAKKLERQVDAAIKDTKEPSLPME